MRVSTTVVHAGWRASLRSAHDSGGARQPSAGVPMGLGRPRPIAPVPDPGPPRPLVLLELASGDGLTGYGEAAPLASYDGVSLEQVLAALTAYGPVLAASDGDDHAGTLAACAGRAALPQALAAVDLALWDLAGRRADQPVWQLLGAERAQPLAINAVIGAVSPAAAADEAAAAVRAGFGCVKVKIGIGDDLARVRAVRATVGPSVALRVDANGAWAGVGAAVAALEALAPLGIELCEEPVHGAAAIAAVTAATAVPIAVDESTADPAVWRERVADAVCLKIAAGGGISGVLEQAAAARALGYAVLLASTLDGPLGIAAALHAAAVVQPDRACGLSTLDRFAVAPPFSVSGGRLAPPAGPGLGDGLLDWYASLA